METGARRQKVAPGKCEIKVSDEAYEYLLSCQQPGESLEDVIRRLMDRKE